MSFRLVQTVATLSDFERRNCPYLASFRWMRYLWRNITSHWLKTDL